MSIALFYNSAASKVSIGHRSVDRTPYCSPKSLLFTIRLDVLQKLQCSQDNSVFTRRLLSTDGTHRNRFASIFGTWLLIDLMLDAAASFQMLSFKPHTSLYKKKCMSCGKKLVTPFCNKIWGSALRKKLVLPTEISSSTNVFLIHLSIKN